MNLSDLRIIVTGAASGMGRCFALSLRRSGARVAALDLDEAGLTSLLAEDQGGQGSLHTRVCNVAHEDEVVSAVTWASETLGGVNALVNNAGIFRDGFLVKVDRKSGSLKRMSLAQWQAVIDVDLTGPFLMTREVAAQMVERGLRPGVVVNISSVSRQGNIGQSNYSAAKAGLVADTRLWARELAPHGIRVAAIAPGFVRTPILEAMRPEILDKIVAQVPVGRLGEPEELFQGLRFILECDFFNAKCLDLDGGLDL